MHSQWISNQVRFECLLIPAAAVFRKFILHSISQTFIFFNIKKFSVIFCILFFIYLRKSLIEVILVNKLYSFQVNRFTEYYLYILWCVPHPSPFISPFTASSASLHRLPFGNHHTVFGVQESFFLCLIPQINFSFKDLLVFLLHPSNLYDSELLWGKEAL